MSSTFFFASFLVFPLRSIGLLFPVTGLGGASSLHTHLVCPDSRGIFSQFTIYRLSSFYKRSLILPQLLRYFCTFRYSLVQNQTLRSINSLHHTLTHPLI